MKRLLGLADLGTVKSLVQRPMPSTAQPLPELLQAKPELFGSAVRGEFALAHSDIDFIVRMIGRCEPGYARRFCDFADALEELYGRPVDLLTELMIENLILVGSTSPSDFLAIASAQAALLFKLGVIGVALNKAAEFESSRCDVIPDLSCLAFKRRQQEGARLDAAIARQLELLGYSTDPGAGRMP